MVRYPDGRVNRAGIDILRQLVRQRIEAIDPQLALNLDGTNPASNVQAIFDSPKTTDNTPETFELLRKAHLLEYRYYRDNKLTIWRDVHPLIANCDKFKEAIVKLKEGK
jgi:hypothetical protein